MSVLKNVENKVKLVTITCGLFLFGCIVISLGSMFTARQMVDDAHKQIYVLDSNSSRHGFSAFLVPVKTLFSSVEKFSYSYSINCFNT